MSKIFRKVAVVISRDALKPWGVITPEGRPIGIGRPDVITRYWPII